MIAEGWKDITKKKIYIAVGCTHGFTASLEDMPANQKSYNKLLKKAKEFDEKLERCVECGEILEERYGYDGEYDCCSKNCADSHYNLTEEDTF